MRQRNKPWADEFIEENRKLILEEPSQYKGIWQDVFNNDGPIHLEIGTGKGQFIIGMAKQNPTTNFIGMELSKNVIVSAAEKILLSEAQNIKLLNEDANNLALYFNKNEISEIYLNFSDPWPKNRHKKRRLTHEVFLEQYAKILKDHHELIFKTDNRELFEYSLVSFSNYNVTLKDISLDLHAINDLLNIRTEYEEKFSAKGHSIYQAKVEFNSSLKE